MGREGVTGRMDRLCICMFADEIDGFRILCHALNYKTPTQGGRSEGKQKTNSGLLGEHGSAEGGWGGLREGLEGAWSEQMSYIGRERKEESEDITGSLSLTTASVILSSICVG